LEFRQQTLDNGLEIVAECNPHAHSAALGFFVKAGSRDETDANNGVSHFLEHMAFKGTPTRSAADVNRELDEIGSMSNAYTTEEQTVYYAAFLPEYQDRAVELLGDILRPSLREDDFEMEKRVILEEIAKYDDQPPYGAHDKCMTAHFRTHPLGRTVLGSTQSVGALSRQQMLDYFRSRYSPGNIVVALAGRVDFPAVVQMLDRQCGRWEPSDAPRTTVRAAQHRSLEVYCKESSVQQYVVQTVNGPAVEDADRYAGRVLATVLGDDSGSRLFWELVDTGLAECAALASYEYQGTGIFMTYLSCSPEDTEGNLEAVRLIYEQAQRTGIAEEELQQAKSKILSHLVLQSERPANRLFSVGNNWLQHRHYRTVRQTMELYQRVTRDDVQAVLERYPLDQPTIVSVGPLTELNGCPAQPMPAP
jgi:predicted Zn-dependent peptidase